VYWRLLAAVFWLVLGGTLLAMRWMYPDVPQWSWNVAGLPAGWIAILFAMYNLLQMWIAHALSQRRSDQDGAFARRQRRTASAPEREPDPNFNFTEPPPEHRDSTS
jgi:hypothetical protein